MKRLTIPAAALAIFAVFALFHSIRPMAEQTALPSLPPGAELATFAAGCFWCTESDFDKVPGVLATTSGYIGGKTKNPTYRQVSSGSTGHTEAVQIQFDPKKVTYRELLAVYWRNVDATDADGQFCDRGDQYRPAIFTHSDEQRQQAEASKVQAQKDLKVKQPIVVEIAPATTFTAAEGYHQDYYNKESLRYQIYRYGCGRDARLEALWGKK